MIDFGISGRKALICGGSSGLGYGCAEALAKCGVKLILNSRNEERLQKACNSLGKKTGAEIVLAAADITTDEGRKLVMEKAGDVDILVNNSGGRLLVILKIGIERIGLEQSTKTCWHLLEAQMLYLPCCM